MFETVFHEVPIGARSPQVLYAGFADRMLSPVRLTADLLLIDLSSDGLRRLRVHRSHLVESTAAQYPRTRAWAGTLRDAAPDAAGLTWIARQRDRSIAVALDGWLGWWRSDDHQTGLTPSARLGPAI